MWGEPGGLPTAELRHRRRDWGWQCPPLRLASSWVLVPRVLVPAWLWGEGGWHVALSPSHPIPVPTYLAAPSMPSCSSALPPWPLDGGTSVCGGAPSQCRSITSRLQRTRGDGSGVPGNPPTSPAPALTAAVLLHQGHLEAVPARLLGVDVHGEMGHSPAQGLAHRRRVTPEHPSALAGGTREGQRPGGTPRTPLTPEGCCGAGEVRSPVLDDDAGAGAPGAVLAPGARLLLRGIRLLRCLGHRRPGAALPPAGSHPGESAGWWGRGDPGAATPESRGAGTGILPWGRKGGTPRVMRWRRQKGPHGDPALGGLRKGGVPGIHPAG